MDYKSLLVVESRNCMTVTINRDAQRNSINNQLLIDLHHVLDIAEHDPNCRFIILQGKKGIFCSGMDFQEMIQTGEEVCSKKTLSEEYMRLLKRFTTTAKVIISIVDGQVLAGGVGVVSASDIVLGTDCAVFGLSEILWGLLPACVLPFLIRRVGFQKAYYMTLMTQNINASEAYRIGLIDEVTESSGESLRRIMLRLNRVEEQTVGDLKAYFRKMWIISEKMEETAVAEITRLTDKTTVHENIKNFVNHKSFPWENSEKWG